jgi:membrane fusion protein, heavy metal efflux system
MKKTILGLLGVALVLAVAAVGLSALRPDLVPSWARLNTAQAVDYGLFCKEHGVPEKFCTLCHPELKKTLLLCPEHDNIPEDVDTKCHPENARKYDIKLCPHGLPEHFCPKCHPENFPKGDGESASADPNLINDGWCAEFGERGPDGKVKLCKLLPIVRLATPELGKEIGLATTPTTEVEHVHELSANAETAYDANRYAEITPRVTGFLRETRLDLGDSAKSAQVIAVVDSSEVSTAKAQYIAAQDAYRLTEDTYRRVSTLTATHAMALKEEIYARSAQNQARANLLNAEQKLRNFRFDDAALAQILKTSDTRPHLEITTPIEGTVVFRHAVLGEAVEPTTKLYTVADVSKIWLWIDVYERDVAKVKAGQAVSFSVSGSGSASEEESFNGQITWVGSEVDHTTRTTKVRAEFPNPERKLRANQFGHARIQVGEKHKAVILAKSAVQRYENTDLVFLTRGDKTFRPQRVKTIALASRDSVEVTWGLKAGQEVVTDGSFLLKTEIMKGSIGAGCCD